MRPMTSSFVRIGRSRNGRIDSGISLATTYRTVKLLASIGLTVMFLGLILKHSVNYQSLWLPVLLGGVAFFAEQWWFLRIYDALRESAIFIIMLAVGVATTVASRAGFVGVCLVPRTPVVRASLWLLVATALALAVSVTFRGDRYLAAVYPIIFLAVLQRGLLYRLTRSTGT